MVHLVVTCTGILALLTLFPQAARMLLLLGAAYVAWMGIALLRSRPAAEVATTAAPVHSSAVFRYAVLTCLLNPKAYAFIQAVFPGFLHTPERSMLAQAVALGSITAATQIAVHGAAALAAVQLRRRVGEHSSVRLWMPRAVGLLLLATALVCCQRATSTTVLPPAAAVG